MIKVYVVVHRKHLPANYVYLAYNISFGNSLEDPVSYSFEYISSHQPIINEPLPLLTVIQYVFLTVACLMLIFYVPKNTKVREGEKIEIQKATNQSLCIAGQLNNRLTYIFFFSLRYGNTKHCSSRRSK